MTIKLELTFKTMEELREYVNQNSPGWIPTNPDEETLVAAPEKFKLEETTNENKAPKKRGETKIKASEIKALFKEYKSKFGSDEYKNLLSAYGATQQKDITKDLFPEVKNALLAALAKEPKEGPKDVPKEGPKETVKAYSVLLDDFNTHTNKFGYDATIDFIKSLGYKSAQEIPETEIDVVRSKLAAYVPDTDTDTDIDADLDIFG